MKRYGYVNYKKLDTLVKSLKVLTGLSRGSICYKLGMSTNTFNNAKFNRMDLDKLDRLIKFAKMSGASIPKKLLISYEEWNAIGGVKYSEHYKNNAPTQMVFDFGEMEDDIPEEPVCSEDKYVVSVNAETLVEELQMLRESYKELRLDYGRLYVEYEEVVRAVKDIKGILDSAKVIKRKVK